MGLSSKKVSAILGNPLKEKGGDDAQEGGVINLIAD